MKRRTKPKAKRVVKKPRSRRLMREKLKKRKGGPVEKSRMRSALRNKRVKGVNFSSLKSPKPGDIGITFKIEQTRRYTGATPHNIGIIGPKGGFKATHKGVWGADRLIKYVKLRKPRYVQPSKVGAYGPIKVIELS